MGLRTILRGLILCSCATTVAGPVVTSARGQEPLPSPSPAATATPTPVPSPGPTPTPSPDPRPDRPVSDGAAGAARAFAAEISRLSTRADAVDRVWQVYRARCQPEAVKGYDFGREWFALWDRSLVPTPKDAGCGNLLQQVVAEGGTVLMSLTAADSLARHSGVSTATIHGTVRWNGLEWWPLTARATEQASRQAANH